MTWSPFRVALLLNYAAIAMVSIVFIAANGLQALPCQTLSGRQWCEQPIYPAWCYPAFDVIVVIVIVAMAFLAYGILTTPKKATP